MNEEIQNYVEYEVNGPVATITLNRPEKLNATTLPRLKVLNDAIRRFDRDPNLWIAVLRAKGRSFCAGRDITHQAETGESPSEGGDRDINEYGLPRTGKILVTSGRGHAIGAGAHFLLAGDVRVVSENLQFGMREVPTAVIGPYWIGVGEHLPPAIAFRVAVMGDDLSADELIRYGLVTAVVKDDELEQETERWVNRLLQLPPAHAIQTKRMLRENGYQYTQAVNDRELHVRSVLDALADTREAAQAFAEKRKPHFTGQ